MKIIQAMKILKENEEKIVALQLKIGQNTAHLSHETPEYGTETEKMVTSWVQTCENLARDNIKLLTAIARTNLVTQVTIEIGEHRDTKSIAEWVWRRRKYAQLDLATWQKLGDRGLKEGVMQVSTGAPIQVKLVRNYDPKLRDKKVAEYQSEPHKIDAALEVINAVTDLVEQ